MVLLDDNYLCDTIIAGNIYLSGNKIMETRDSVLSSLLIAIHIGDAKYRI